MSLTTVGLRIKKEDLANLYEIIENKLIEINFKEIKIYDQSHMIRLAFLNLIYNPPKDLAETKFILPIVNNTKFSEIIQEMHKKKID